MDTEQQTHNELKHMSKEMVAGIVALVVIAAGVIWYLSDTRASAPAPVVPSQPVAQQTKPTAPRIIPGASIDLPTMEKSLADMATNLKTIDDLKDL